MLNFIFDNYWDKKRDSVISKLSLASSILLKYKTLSKRASAGSSNSSLSDCCKSFVTTTPTSLVEHVALRFFVHSCNEGGWTEGEEGKKIRRGALIPANPKVYTEDEEGFEVRGAGCLWLVRFER